MSTLLLPSLPGGGGGGASGGDSGGSIAVTGCWDHAARLVDLRAGAQVGELRWHDASIYALAGVEVAAAAAGSCDGGAEDAAAEGDATAEAADETAVEAAPTEAVGTGLPAQATPARPAA